MKPVQVLGIAVGAAAVLALIGVAVRFSIKAGHPSWVLMAVLVVDSIALMALTVWAMVSGRRRRPDGRG